MAVPLNKALFYFDLILLREAGETFTRNTYIALPQGPVVSNYEKRLLRDMPKLGLASLLNEQRGGYESKTLQLEEGIGSELPGALTELAGEVARKIGRVTAAQVSDFSHANPGWDLAIKQGVGTGVNMHLALQQLLDEDDWLGAEEDEFARSLRASERDSRIRW